MSTGAIIGIVIGVVFGGVVVLGILASMLLPALARAKSKANRVKCVNNCSSNYRAMLGFAQENGERLPWQLTPAGVRLHLDGAPPGSAFGMQQNSSLNEVNAHPYMLQTAGVWGLTAVKMELQTPKILHSPCDPARTAQNQLVQTGWGSYDTNADGVSDELGRGTSYTLVRGADSMRPASVLLVTRNWSGDNLGSGHWLGADSDSSNDRTMAGLYESQGQVVQMDGSAKQSHNADFGASGKITNGANQATGGNAKGATSLSILRGAGL